VPSPNRPRANLAAYLRQLAKRQVHAALLDYWRLIRW
jgi:hypothetical protein